MRLNFQVEKATCSLNYSLIKFTILALKQYVSFFCCNSILEAKNISQVADNNSSKNMLIYFLPIIACS